MDSDICASCGLEKRVTGSSVVVRGDSSPDTQTRVYNVLTLECRNPNCPDRGKQSEVWNEISIASGKDATGSS